MSNALQNIIQMLVTFVVLKTKTRWWWIVLSVCSRRHLSVHLQIGGCWRKKIEASFYLRVTRFLIWGFLGSRVPSAEESRDCVVWEGSKTLWVDVEKEALGISEFRSLNAEGGGGGCWVCGPTMPCACNFFKVTSLDTRSKN